MSRNPRTDGEATRELILEAALEAFAEVGYEALSVRELTRRLGVSHNLVHHHFGSKQELWRAAVDHGFGRKARELLGMIDAGERDDEDPVETLRRVIEQFVTFSARMPAIPKILAREFSEDSERLQYLYDEYVREGLEVGKRFIEHLPRGRATTLGPADLLLFIMNGTLAYFTQAAMARRMGRPALTSPEAIARHASDMADLVLCGLVGKG